MVDTHRPTHNATLEALDASLVAKRKRLKDVDAKLLARSKEVETLLSEKRLLESDIEQLNADYLKRANP